MPEQYKQLSEEEISSTNLFDLNLYSILQSNLESEKEESPLLTYTKSYIFFYGLINLSILIFAFIIGAKIKLGINGTIIIHILPFILAFISIHFKGKNKLDKRKKIDVLHASIMAIYKFKGNKNIK